MHRRVNASQLGYNENDPTSESTKAHFVQIQITCNTATYVWQKNNRCTSSDKPIENYYFLRGIVSISLQQSIVVLSSHVM